MVIIVIMTINKKVKNECMHRDPCSGDEVVTF